MTPQELEPRDSFIQRLATRHPYLCASALFTLIMAGVKFGAGKIVTTYGAPGALITIGAIIALAALIDRR